LTPERWQRVKELFESALEYEAEERAAFLNAACRDDSSLRRAVESLIVSYEEDKSFLETPAVAAAPSFIAASIAELAGQSINHYKIIRQIGSGGMGDVYLADDTLLGRRVAIKLLPAIFTTDPDRLWRFAQEARAASVLSHSNVCTVHAVGAMESGQHYIVMEYVEGVTLRRHMQNAPLQLGEALDIGVQIAGALSAAHAAGIVHRDIKPENIMVRHDGIIKVLDFGLAKLTAPSSAGLDTLSETGARTNSGMVMGTTSYMAPEQARGLTVDARADVWSLGVVLYEMVAGRAPFAGETPSDIIVAILEHEPPPLANHLPDIPFELQRIITKALRKDREERYQVVKDMLLDLKSLRLDLEFAVKLRQAAPSANGTTASAAGAGAPQETERLSSAALLISRIKHHKTVLAMALALTMMLAWIVLMRLAAHRDPIASSAVRFLIPPPEKGKFKQMVDLYYTVAVSPDGRKLALIVGGEGRQQMWVRSLDGAQSQLLAGTEGADEPFWSPDSRFIGFFADGKLKKIEATGGLPQTLSTVPFGPVAWSRDGTILIAAQAAGLFRVPANGGEAVQIRKPDAARQDYLYLWPCFLPDGRHFLYFSGNDNKPGDVLIGSLDSSETRVLMQTESGVQYAAPGYLLFVNEGTLLAQPFDADHLRLMGEPFPMAENLRYFKPTGGADFSVSENGVLAFQAGAIESRLVWFNRSGAEVGTVGVPAEYVSPRLSPDGQKLAVDIFDLRLGTTDIWLYDLLHNTARRFTIDPGMENQPLWSPDQQQIVFAADRRGPPFLHVKDINDDGSGTALVAPSGHRQIPNDWAQTPEGQFIIYEDRGAETGRDLMLLPMFGERQPRPFLRTPASEWGAHFSPDGRWVAYLSNETGRDEVYVRGLQASGRKWQISTAGGAFPRWRRDGKELFYLAHDHHLMAVPLHTGATIEAGTPVPLFPVEAGVFCDVTADGQRFLIKTTSGIPPLPITVVLNWTADIRH
jgi:eukaryotic-like serine/threonine-protein kinase